MRVQEILIFISRPLPFVSAFVDELDGALQQHQPGRKLSSTQRGWLSLCLMAIMVTNAVCWARFERASLGRYSVAALSWMFRHTKLVWEVLFQMSVRVILLRYGIRQGGGISR